MDGKRPRLKPGTMVVADGREGQLLHPERPGCPDGPWVVLFADGMAGVFKQERMEAVE